MPQFDLDSSHFPWEFKFIGGGNLIASLVSTGLLRLSPGTLLWFAHMKCCHLWPGTPSASISTSESFVDVHS